MVQLIRHIHIMKTKLNLNDPINENEHVPDFLEELRKKENGFNVPKGYFSSLSPRIVDRINNQKTGHFFALPLRLFGKPVIVVPAMASIILTIILIFSIPATKNQATFIVDELTEMNMAYDISYAEEVMLAEAHIIDNELESTNSDIESVAIDKVNEPTVDEMTEYLKSQEIDTEILN